MRGLLIALACYAASAAPPATVRLGHITPFSGAWRGGLQMEAAVVLALEDVNAATNILGSTKLERVVKDDECDPGLGMKAFIGKSCASGVDVGSWGGDKGQMMTRGCRRRSFRAARGRRR